MCKNKILTPDIDGRILAVVVIIHELPSGERQSCFIKLAPDEFHELDRIFPAANWVLNNGYPAIPTLTPDGEETKVMVARTLDYIQQRQQHLDGGPAPVKKGFVMKYREH